MAIRTTPGSTAALTIAGSDPSGGAGIQADLKIFATMGVFGCSALTAVTVQNTQAVQHILALDPKIVDQQIDAVAGDIAISATKTGMLVNDAIATVVVNAIKRNKLAPLVVDPVITATSGDRLTNDQALAVMRRAILPLATIVTPNAAEAAKILNRTDPAQDVYSASESAKQICGQFGAKTCIVTGIERKTDDGAEAVDVFFNGSEIHELVSDWRPTSNLHGSGCTFSAAITAALALGESIEQAIQIAKKVVSEAIRQTTDLGHGSSPVNHIAHLQIK